MVLGLSSDRAFCVFFTGSGNRASNPRTETWRLLVSKTSLSDARTSTTQSALGLPVWGNAVAFRRLRSRKTMEKRSSPKSKRPLFVLLWNVVSDGASDQSDIVLRSCGWWCVTTRNLGRRKREQSAKSRPNWEELHLLLPRRSEPSGAALRRWSLILFVKRTWVLWC